MQECIIVEFAKAWGTKVEIMRIDGASKPWEPMGGAKVLAPGIPLAWFMFRRSSIQARARNQSRKIKITERVISVG
ncbi:hypothetical protein COCNU_04G009650 [Cocos nucifera]|uniref:Uncharacterized protein n=1 Tax=Cocos nucifera TaxID=13894 RepID=A0A8K0N0W7_COCNU|nr:hypothetical protein COCNU_04G009650 [Cocos nucifera]